MKTNPQNLTQNRSLRMESLEQRLCLTLTVYFDADIAGLLHVEGTRGDDTILIQDFGQGKVTITDGTSGERFEHEGVADLVVHAGEGNDVIRFAHRGGGDVAGLDVFADAGDDSVVIGLLLPAVQKVRDAAARMNIDLGEGNNRLQVNSQGIDTIDLDVTAGEGTDAILIGLLLPAVQKVRDAAGAAPVGLTIDSGDGDDAVLIGLLLPAVQKVREAAASVPVDVAVQLGDGNNDLKLHANGIDDLGLDITAGDGDDAVLIGLLLPAVQKVRDAAARMDADLGGGNNRLQLNSVGIGQLDLDITAEGGDDAILIGLLLPAVQKVRDAAARSASISVHLGDGTDSLQLRTIGFAADEVFTQIGEDVEDVRLHLGKPIGKIR